MSAALVLFLRLVVRPLRREPIRAALTLIAVSLGVAVVVAIDLAGQSAASSFQSSLETLVGKNDLVITANGGLDERVLGKLAELPYPLALTPRIEDFATVNGKGEAILLLGLDLVGMANQSSLVNQFQSTQAEAGGADLIWTSGALQLHRGERVRLLINARLHEFTVAGVLPEQQNLFIVDIGLAQSVTGKQGKLDSIDVKLPASGSLSNWQAILRANLPAGIDVAPQGARTDQNRKMLAAFRWNLRVLSYIALLVGGFLIYNTISISVVRRRAEIGIVRALGGTRREVLAAFLWEALLFAVAGSAVGILLGRVMALGATALVGATVESLYVTSHAAPVHLNWGAVISGCTIGIGVSLLGALAPALEAARVTPVEAMARGRKEFVNTMRSRRTIPLACLMLMTAAGLTQLPPIQRTPVFAYLAVLLLVCGTSLLIPNIVSVTAGFATSSVNRLLGVEAALAMRSLRASLGRTSVLTAALATAVAMTAAVGIMVGSFRETVSVWINNELTADFYLRPAGSAAADRHPILRASIADAIERVPGVDAVDRFRAYPIVYEGLPATFAGGETSKIEGRGATRFLPGENAPKILSTLSTGDYAIVSEPFANKHNVSPGSVIELPLAGAMQRFKVLGIYYDYSTERGFIIVDRGTLLKYLPDAAASNLAVYLKPNANALAVRRGIDDVLSGESVLLFSNGTLRRGAIAIFDRTFRITYALEAVAVIVAVLGIAGSLLALIIDRRREFAVLRFLGAARQQIRGIVLFEAGLLGLLANAIGLVLGTLLSIILIFVINKQSFGWTIQFHWPVALLLGMLTGIYLATALAGLYPGHVATTLDPIEAIHEE